MIFQPTAALSSLACFVALANAASSCSSGYGQCGGNGWTGPTCCESGYTCTEQNEWYSQCIPGVANAGANTKATVAHSHTSSSAKTTLAVAATSKKATSTSSKLTPVASSSNGNSAPVTGGSGISFTPVSGGRSGTGHTTRYWDCCKPSCSWSGKANVNSPVKACLADGVTAADVNAQSGCNGGNSYMCSNQQPFAVNSTLAYGFAAASMIGAGESDLCCSCGLLNFNSGAPAGKQMVVQITNTGSDLYSNHFDIAMPGGGFGIFNGCVNQWNVSADKWGQTYGGVSSADQCNNLPSQLQKGCDWRWDFLNGGDNPDVSFVQIECPAEITAISGCKRN